MISASEKLLQVMEPVSHPAAFDNADFLYQFKWDGVRMLAVLEGDSVKLINKRGHERTLQYPELQKLPQLVKARQAILDGEIVVLKGGRPSFPTVMRRDQASQAKTIEHLQYMLPVNYMVFDLLSIDNELLLDRPLEYRQEKLRQKVTNQDFLQLVEDFPQGVALFNSVCAMGLEGIVAKHRQSRYIAGKKHRDWLKIKCRLKQNCLIGGYTLRGQVVNALLLGVYQDDRFIFVGRAGSGLNSEQQEILSSGLPPLRCDKSPFDNLTRPPAGGYFVEPRLGARIEFQEWTEEMSLRSPVIKEFAVLTPAECTI
ncbi:non-homologous end-joining DNA ligase [Syntrophomonas palmitatica]|uniref:non-homologous end-joining DNA ligase n=1 Tax=Syntrophomonas palmitatica TaxID=402877 RepID=UPI0006CFC300|nr:non-homologous end-joining DNA ligase [Syntrophomonas palmitatica]